MFFLSPLCRWVVSSSGCSTFNVVPSELWLVQCHVLQISCVCIYYVRLGLETDTSRPSHRPLRQSHTPKTHERALPDNCLKLTSWWVTRLLALLQRRLPGLWRLCPHAAQTVCVWPGRWLTDRCTDRSVQMEWLFCACYSFLQGQRTLLIFSSDDFMFWNINFIK